MFSPNNGCLLDPGTKSFFLQFSFEFTLGPGRMSFFFYNRQWYFSTFFPRIWTSFFFYNHLYNITEEFNVKK